MKKFLTIGFALMLIFAIAASGVGESLFVDNRETDKIYPERLNLRAEPTKNGAILGLYYTGAQVNVLNVENEEYVRVEIGGMNGYMAREYLITAEEAVARYGEDSGFGDCRAAEVDLSGLWMQSVAMHAQTDLESETVAPLENGASVSLVGILNDWAYVASGEEGAKVYGYLPLDVLTDVGELKVSIISSGKSDAKTILYDAPNDKADEIMSLSNGTACFSLFGRKEGEWRRVRVGGVAGWIRYTQVDNLYPLGNQPRSVVPYYPLLMQTKGDTLLYSVKGNASQAYMTLGDGMKVELLAECGDYAYVRTYEGGPGAYDCGDYGYVALADLSLTQAGESIGVAQVDDGDLPAVVLSAPEEDAEMIGALCSGAQVRIVSYTQTDYVQVKMGDLTGYIPKSEIRVLTEPDAPLSDKIPQRATTLTEVALLSKPQDGAKEVEHVAQGERVYMLGKVGNWAYVLAGTTPSLDVTGTLEDRAGFVKIEQLNAPASTTHLTAFVNTDKVNLRNEASRSGEIIARARTEMRLRVTDYGNDWTCVVLPDGTRGYIMTEYLDFE